MKIAKYSYLIVAILFSALCLGDEEIPSSPQDETVCYVDENQEKSIPCYRLEDQPKESNWEEDEDQGEATGYVFGH